MDEKDLLINRQRREIADLKAKLRMLIKYVPDEKLAELAVRNTPTSPKTDDLSDFWSEEV